MARLALRLRNPAAPGLESGSSVAHVGVSRGRPGSAVGLPRGGRLSVDDLRRRGTDHGVAVGQSRLGRSGVPPQLRTI